MSQTIQPQRQVPLNPAQPAHPPAAQTNGQGAEQPRQKRFRSPSVAKPAFIVMQVLDEQGQPVEFSKSRLRIIACERNAEKILEMTDGGQHQHSFYLRVVVPAERATPPKTTDQPSAA